MNVPGAKRIRNISSDVLNSNNLNPSLFYSKFAEWDPNCNSDIIKEAKKTHLSRLIRAGEWYKKPSDLAGYIHSGANNSFNLTTVTRLLIGRATPSVFEHGISIHPLFGVPFLPGSAIKGVTRHWAMETKKPSAMIQKYFGHEPSDEKDTGAEGIIIFFDAVPLTIKCLEIEILTPHYPDYYKESREWPSDEEQPTILQFPAIKSNTQFRFALGFALPFHSNQDSEDCLDKIGEWVKLALKEFGIGSKTGSNYGYFK